MSNPPRSVNRGRPFTAVLITAAFVWTLLLSVSPQLHQRIHSDAKQVDHICAVTFVSTGSYEHAAQPPLSGALFQAVQFSKIAPLHPSWVESPFLAASIFEHAPPVNS